MRKAARLVLFVFSVAGVACAQIPTRGNIFAGYSYMRADSDVFPAIIPTSGVNAQTTTVGLWNRLLDGPCPANILGLGRLW